MLALMLAATAYAFYQAGASEDLRPATLDGAAQPVPSAPLSEVLRVAFGSCNRQAAPQPFWGHIAAHQPAAWLWLGDIVYADTEDMAAMAADYQQQQQQPDYAAFVAQTPAVYGVWDDHDYGKNDGGKEWPHQDEASRLLLDFLNVPADAITRQRPGVYQAYTLQQQGMAIRLILLDTRSFRDPLAPPVQPGHRYGPNPEGSVLGAEQTGWLKEQLAAARTHDFCLIGSSIQVLPTEHGYEKWANFPAAREALLDLIATHGGPNTLLLSGDRHLAEISRLEHQGKVLHEVTSSGLTHAYEAADEPNAYRVSPLIGERNYGLLHFVRDSSGTRLLAQVRSIVDDRVLADLALGADGQAVDPVALREQVAGPPAVSGPLQPCPDKPNCVNSQTDKARPSIAYTGSREAARQRLETLIAKLPRTRLISAEANYLHYTFRTFPVPFIDDVEFLFNDTEKVIHYRSASRVGHSDLGVNARRMDKIVKAFHEQ